jgi:multidrug efflux pump subunit AcrB
MPGALLIAIYFVLGMLYESYAVGPGPGFALRQPPGIAIVGGMIVAQLFTLYTTSVIYCLMSRAAGPRGQARKR